MDTEYSCEMLEKFDRFKQGCFLIFKKWTAFRLALDNNPELLTVYYDEEKTELEIYYMLRLLLSDIDDEINKYNSKVAINLVAEMLFDFIQGYFHIEIEDQSDKLVARDIVNLHGELFKEDKFKFFEELKLSEKNFKGNFSIDFPITKKSIENKLIIDNMKKMEIDNDSETENTITEDEEETKNDKEKNLDNEDDDKNKLTLKKNEPDSDGFIEVKKNKRMKNKISKKTDDMDIDTEPPNQDDIFVEAKKKKKK